MDEEVRGDEPHLTRPQALLGERRGGSRDSKLLVSDGTLLSGYGFVSPCQSPRSGLPSRSLPLGSAIKLQQTECMHG